MLECSYCVHHNKEKGLYPSHMSNFLIFRGDHFCLNLRWSAGRRVLLRLDRLQVSTKLCIRTQVQRTSSQFSNLSERIRPVWWMLLKLWNPEDWGSIIPLGDCDKSVKAAEPSFLVTSLVGTSWALVQEVHAQFMMTVGNGLWTLNRSICLDTCMSCRLSRFEKREVKHSWCVSWCSLMEVRLSFVKWAASSFQADIPVLCQKSAQNMLIVTLNDRIEHFSPIRC